VPLKRHNFRGDLNYIVLPPLVVELGTATMFYRGLPYRHSHGLRQHMDLTCINDDVYLIRV
jgi:hypothetical protein